MANYFILVLILYVFWTVIDGHPCSTRESLEGVCLEPRCIQTTARILNVMDLAADPCEDFYQYACGKYAEVKDIPPGIVKLNPLQELQLKNRNHLKKLLDREGYEIKGVHSEALRKAKTYYETCMNETNTDAAGASPLLDMIESIGGWSLLDGTRAGRQNMSLSRRLAMLHKVNVRPLFGMAVDVDDKDPNVNTAQLRQSGLSHYKYTNKNDTKIQAWFELGATVMTLLRDPAGDAEFAQMKEEARATMIQNFEFEKSLSKINIPKAKLRNDIESYNMMPLRQLIASAPHLDLQTYMNEVFGREIDPELEVVVYTPAYFRKLSKIIKNTPQSVVENYCLWYAVQAYTGMLSKPYQDARFEYYKAISGVTERTERASQCISEVDLVFGFVTGAWFVEEIVSADVKNKTIEMLYYIKDAFLENLQDVGWMDDKTRDFAADKLRAVTEKIGFPDWILDPEKLDEYFSDLPVSTTSWMENALNVARRNIRQRFGRLTQPVDKLRWALKPSAVNAIYDFSLNQVTFPSGILQEPFFSSDRPMSMNFGGIGLFMGHELTHGFDTQGRQYDKHGRLNSRSWSEDEYNERAKCLVTQYSEYQIHGHNLNGKQTLNENIADNGGYKLAYLAYQKWRQNNTDEIRLPLNMTTDQEFFLAASQVWCNFYTPEFAIQEIQSGSHINNKFRAIGPLSNIPAFSEAFACPVGSPMNPERKCQVW